MATVISTISETDFDSLSQDQRLPSEMQWPLLLRVGSVIIFYPLLYPTVRELQQDILLFQGWMHDTENRCSGPPGFASGHVHPAAHCAQKGDQTGTSQSIKAMCMGLKMESEGILEMVFKTYKCGWGGICF